MNILFSGYAPVHALCFLPIYHQLRKQENTKVYLSGGFRTKHEDGTISFSSEGFYDAFDVDEDDVISVEDTKKLDVDVLVCSHLSDALFPKSHKASVQIYHGVSFKNYLVREKVLVFDHLCIPGNYHVEKYRDKGMIKPDGSKMYKTGFSKLDALVNQQFDKKPLCERLGLDASKPIILYAPTGDKNNSLEIMGEELVQQFSQSNDFNLLIKPHDHPKRKIDWFEKFRTLESKHIKVVKDLDIVPLLGAADLLISDASSVITEFTLLDRPIVLLDVPKLFKRVLVRGGALDLHTYGHNLGPVLKTPKKILKTITKLLKDSSMYSPLRQKMAKHVFHEPGSATDRVVSVINFAATGNASFLSQVPVITE